MHKVIGFVVGLSLIVPAVAFANTTVTTSVDTGSNISPSSAVITPGNSQVFNISPNTGWHLSNVSFDGISQGTPSVLTISEDGSDHTLSAQSESNGGGGLVFCSGPMAPGYIVGQVGGGCGGTTMYVPFNGTSCLFNQGCMVKE